MGTKGFNSFAIFSISIFFEGSISRLCVILFSASILLFLSKIIPLAGGIGTTLTLLLFDFFSK